MTPLSYALLGLIQMEPRSGYALRKVFETTPLGSYSSSPGSIYPALKSLESAGLVETRGAHDARGKGLYHLTDSGRDALEAWLDAPVSDLSEAMLRFAFLPEDNRPRILAFLDAFEAAAKAKGAGLDIFLASDAARPMTPKARIAVLHGRRGLQASADWAAWAREQFTTENGDVKS
jgi:DNA-binding PadR family transcriptional regulator